MKFSRSAAAGFIIAIFSTVVPAAAQDTGLDALVTAYPDALTKHDNRALFWRDGTITEIAPDEPKPFEQTLRAASLFDQMRLRYPRGPIEGPPMLNEDPGRFRNVGFFRKMYGNCWQGEVGKRLMPVVWLPKTYNHMIRATTVNGIAEKLAAISAEIDRLPDKIRRAAYPLSGGYACRGIIDTAQPSMHSYGAAIDLNIGFGDYWYWQRGTNGAISYRNRMPYEIVDIFERHGFIWGGKWYHYDTMHFEYRPELMQPAKNR